MERDGENGESFFGGNEQFWVSGWAQGRRGIRYQGGHWSSQYEQSDVKKCVIK